MKIHHNIVSKVSEFVIKELSQHITEDLYFHNLSHTKDVVNAVKEIGYAQQLSEVDLETLEIAAWFHDLGYIKIYVGHEEESKTIANEFLTKHEYPKAEINNVLKLINATKFPQNPKDILEQIICDADLFHFSCEDYDIHEQNLRKEWVACLDKKYSNTEWARENCELLVLHQYFTAYGKAKLQPKKEANINKRQCRF